MELIRITDQNLKIMLTPSDMTQFELTPEAIDHADAYLPDAFRLLLWEIRRQYGFEFDDKHLTVQYFPSKEGGCEMFVSSMQSTPTGEERERKRRGAGSGNAILPIGKSLAGSFLRETAYRFENLSSLLAACHRLRGIGYIGESSAYRDGGTIYYLLLKMLSASPFSLPDEFAFLCEYGRPENASALRLYFREHGSVICPRDAVEILADLR